MAYTKAPFRVFVHFILVVVLLVAFSSTIKSQTPSDFIKTGQEISQEIKSLDTHSYKITLKTGQYLKLFLEAEKLALEVNLLAPSGENVLRIETDNKEINREELEIVAKSTGTYLLEVISLDNMVAPSPYRVEVKDIRKALLKDKNRCIAKDLTGQANVLQKVGTPIGFEKSVERYLSALPFWRKAGEQAAIADTHRKIAESYYLISKYSESIDYFTKELEFRRSNKERSREARAIKNLGLVYYAMGDDEQALKHYNEALALGKELNNRELIAQTLNLLGTLYRSNGEGRKSIEYNRESLNLWEELNEIEETVKITQDVAASYYSLAEIKDALAFYEKALVAAEKENNKISQAKLLSSMAIIYDEIGDISHALNYYNQALNKWRSLKSPNKESIASELEILENIGKIYYKQKDTRQALNFLEEASELAKESKDNFSQAQILNSIGNVYRASGESRKAIEFYSDALMLHKQNNDLVSTSITATEVAKTHLELGDGDKAVGFFTEAYKLNQRQGNRAIEAGIFYHLGLALEFNYEEEKAIASYKQGIIVAKELQDKIQEAQFNYRLSLLEKRRGHLKESQLSIEKAIELIENLPSKLVNRQLANNYLSKATDYFELYVDLLMQQHKLNPSNANDIAALRVSERERTYILLDLMTTSEINLSANSNKDLVLQENNLKQLISDKTSKLVRFNIAEAPVHEIGEIERELKALSNQLKDLQTEIKQKNPHYANFSQPTPLNLKEIQENILDPETIFLEYSLGNEQSYLWVVSQTEIKSFYLPKRSEIESLAKYLRELVTARNLLAKGEKNIGGRPITLELAENEYPKVALDLSKMLLSPIAEKLGKKRLVIIADGALQYIPFNALPDPNNSYQALLVDHEIVSLPSITTINTIREETKDSKSHAKTVMFVADPIVSLVDNRVRVKSSKDSALLNTSTDLKEANLLIEKSAKEVGLPLTTQGLPRLSVVEDEVKEISQILSKEENKQLFSFNASLSSLSKESSPYKAIHFATYGLVNSLHPELSGVVLSIADEQGNLQDGFLQTHKIFKLNLPTELVTLSNCDTTLSKNAQEEGLTGLTRSFIYAGAKRVMANLWNTNDPASIELMKKFYQKTLKENQAPAFALRAAQLEMLQDEKYKNPFYWAGFQLQGEWK